MSKAPSMPMFWDAYLADTTHLTCEEHGAYLLLLGAMWRRDGSVPNDDKDIARILGVTLAKWRKIKLRLDPFLVIEPETISQENLRKIWKKTQEKIAKNSLNGARGGRASSSNNKDLDQANASNSLKPNQSIPEPEPRKERDTNVSPKKKKGCRIPDNFEPDITWAVKQGLTVYTAGIEAAQFRDFWKAKAGANAVKLNWNATWRNWVRNALKRTAASNPSHQKPNMVSAIDARLERIRNERDDNERRTIDDSKANHGIVQKLIQR